MLKDPFDIARAIIILVFSLFVLLALLSKLGVPIGLNQLAQVSGACVDSDGGISPYTQGTVSYGGQSYTDSCYTGTTVYEYSCAIYPATGVTHTFPNCPSGYSCANGACVAQAPSCYVGVTLKESQNGDSSTFTFQSATTTSEDASPLVNQYYSEEPSPFRVEALDSYKSPLGKYELWSGRFIIAETFSNPPQGELIELPSATVDLFLPLNRNVRSLNIYQGTSTSPISSIYFDESGLVCSVGS